MKKKSNFTFIELVIVVACLAALMTVFNGCGEKENSSSSCSDIARIRALNIKCFDNQCQTVKLIHMATNDNKVFLVSGSCFADSPGDSPAWTRFLCGEAGDTSGSMKGKKRYVSDMEVLRCPVFKYDSGKALDAMNASDREKALSEAYGLVYREKPEPGAKFAGFDFRGRTFETDGSDKTGPSRLILGGCAVADGRRDRAGALLYDGAWKSKPAMVHDGKCNVFFLDGHSEGLTREELEDRCYLPSARDNRAVKFSVAGR